MSDPHIVEQARRPEGSFHLLSAPATGKICKVSRKNLLVMFFRFAERFSRQIFFGSLISRFFLSNRLAHEPLKNLLLAPRPCEQVGALLVNAVLLDASRAGFATLIQVCGGVGSSKGSDTLASSLHVGVLLRSRR